MFWSEDKRRKAFSTKTKKNEWMLAAGKNPFVDKFVKKSKCQVCGRVLIWGERTYDFDHKDNNSANNSQKNCYLVCKSCHGKHTVIKKRRITGLFGDTVGYETIKKKVGYKKPKKKTRRVAVRGLFGQVVGYRTVKIRKPKAAKKTSRSKKEKSKTHRRK